jgi:RNA polymerase sigma factor (sigma-70 family)
VLHNLQDAEDAFQATFLVLVRRGGSIAKPELLGGWLHGVAYRTALRMRAQSTRWHTQDELPENLLSPEPLAELVSRELQFVLDEEVNRLPAKLRTPFVLCCLEGKTYREAAQQLGWPAGTVSSRLADARESLRVRLVRRGFVLSAGLLGSILGNQAASGSVPVTLFGSTIKAATSVAAGKAIALAVSAKVVALTEGVLKAMLLHRLQKAVVSFLVLTMFGLATALVAHSALGHGQAPQAKQGSAGVVVTQKHEASIEQQGPVWKTRVTLHGHKDEVLCLAFGIDQLATASKDGTIKLWDMTTHKELRTCNYPVADGLMKRMEFTADGKHVLMFFGNHLGFWDTTKEIFPKATIGGVTPLVTAVSGKNGHTLVFRGDPKQEADPTRLLIWEVPRFGHIGKDTLGFAGFTTSGPYQQAGEINVAAISEDGAVVVSAAADRTITVWEVETKNKRAVCKGYKENILSLAMSPDGKIVVSAGDDGTIRLWEIATGKELATLKGHKGPVRSVTINPESNTVASGGDDKMVTLWDVKTATKLASLKGHTEAVLAVAFSRDGRMVTSASKDNSIRLWEAEK